MTQWRVAISMNSKSHKRILRTREAAAYCGLSASFLEKARRRGNGPRSLRLTAKAVGYDVADLDDWLNKRPSLGDREVLP